MKEGWEYTTIGESCDVNYGTRVVRARDGGSIYDVYGGGGATFKMDTYNRQDCVVVARFAMSKQCTRFVSGKFYLNDSGLTLTPKKDSSLKQFLLDKLLLALNDTIYECGRGSAQRNLRVDEFKAIKFAFPKDENEQERIVALLDKQFEHIDMLKRNAEYQLKAAKDLFQAARKELLTPKEGWEYREFEKCLKKVPKQKAVKSKDYLEEGKFPIVSQESYIISGYANDEALLYKHDKPVVIFGDHTKNIKYIDFDFVVGADGVHILSTQDDILPKFFYYELRSIKLRDLGYARHYKLLKEKTIGIPPLPEQQQIVTRLDAISERVKALQTNYEQTITLCNDLKQALLKSIFE